MSKQLKWSRATRIALYSAMVEEFGPYDSETWHQVNTSRPPKKCPLSPKGVNTAEQKAAYERIYEKIVPLFVAPFVAPDSVDAIMNQAAWALTTQTRTNTYQRRYRHENRMAAYEAGFFLMSDIVLLEGLTAQRIRWLASDSSEDVE